MDPKPDPGTGFLRLFITNLQMQKQLVFCTPSAYLLQGYVHIEVKEPQHNRYQGSLLFCIMIEGSGSGFGSGSIPLINGSRSGSRRPKTHGDAADSDPVFGSGSATLFYRKPFSGSKTRIFSLAHVKEEFSLGLFFFTMLGIDSQIL
jgi:hypothetical protein